MLNNSKEYFIFETADRVNWRFVYIPEIIIKDYFSYFKKYITKFDILVLMQCIPPEAIAVNYGLLISTSEYYTYGLNKNYESLYVSSELEIEMNLAAWEYDSSIQANPFMRVQYLDLKQNYKRYLNEAKLWKII